MTESNGYRLVADGILFYDLRRIKKDGIRSDTVDFSVR